MIALISFKCLGRSSIRPNKFINVYSSISGFSQSAGTFSTLSNQEPEWLVEPEGTTIQSRFVPQPHVIDAKRLEIYRKHKADPAEWSLKKLSQRYGMHVHRVRAIVHLMGEREALMEELGVLNIPEAWSAVYRDHREEPESMTTSALAEKHNMSEDDVANIVAKMSEHEWRKKNLNDSNSYMDWCLDMMEALGLDSTFKEVAFKKVPGDNQFEAYYEPRLFGDDEYEEAMTRLRDRLIRETKAKETLEKPVLFASFESRVRNWRDVSGDPVVENKADVKVDGPCRWKFAFRELKKKKKGQHPHPTMIRTRRGQFRPANPVEEMLRSWSKQPRGLEIIRAKDRVEALMDPDEDASLGKAISRERRVRKERLLREHGLLKY